MGTASKADSLVNVGRKDLLPSDMLLHSAFFDRTARFGSPALFLFTLGSSPKGLEQWHWLILALIGLLVYQQWRFYRFRQRAERREELFRIVAENAADMIALVDVKGRRLYNSPAYQTVLGYSAHELAETSAFEQIHPEDRFKVLDAAREARSSGVGKKIEYRIRHKNGTWRILESTASVIRNARDEVEKLVIVNRDITERKRAEELLEHNSFHDGLTGLPNRRLFLDRLQRSFVRAQRNPGFRYAVVFVDLDGFKTFNETMGTKVADQVLTELSRRLAACLREDDTVARPKGKLPIPDAVLSRLGGDEFTVLLEGLKDPSDALRVARRIQAAIEVACVLDGHNIRISASIGVALSHDHERPENLLQEADVAMRRAKSLGGSRCEMFDEATHTHADNRLKLEASLRTAIDYEQFLLCYQPVMHLETGKVASLEALVRWNHPEQGLISPARFIEVAESAGLLVPIGSWVIQEACKQLHAWQSRFSSLAEPLSMTINLSAKQFGHAGLIEEIRTIIREIQIEPSRLEFELSENIAMANPRLACDVLTQLRQLGVRISIGDFGTGHLSLSWLRRLPIDEIKIDRSLVVSMSADRASSDVVRLTVAVARELSLKVVAEGIESLAQLDRLKKLGCQLGQGYFFAQPLLADEVEQLLQHPHPFGRANPAGATYR